MGKTYDRLDERLRGWIAAQHRFFVATAPSGPGGHVNLSPQRGYADTFTILDGRTVAYLDLTGSGAETIAHLRDNGWITLMFCAFSGPPRILRRDGRGRLVVPGDDRWEQLAARFPARCGARAVVVVEIERIADSCGYAVPLYAYAGQPPSARPVGRTQGRRRPGRLPHPPQPQEHRRSPGSAHGRQ